MYTKPGIFCGFGLFAIFCGSTQTVTATESYAITDLGTLGGAQSKAYGLNDLGQVIGESDTPSGESHAFLWLPEPAYGLSAGMNDLGTLGGSESAAFGVNNVGQIVGRADTAAPAVSRAFLWDPTTGVMQDLETLAGPSVAYTINDFGEIVGTARDAIGFDQAFHRSEDGTDILFSDPVPGDFVSEGFGIGYTGNLNFAGTTYSPAHAFKFGGETGFLQLDDLGVESFAFGMNELNHAVGSVRSAAYEHAALWEIIALTDLGTLGGVNSRAYAINDFDQIVGESDTAAASKHAFLWQANVMMDLNDLLSANMGWELNEARDIDEDGAIVGSGTVNGQTHAFLLTPAGPVIPTTHQWGLVAMTLLMLIAGTLILTPQARKISVS